jgi:hypothetical protein
MEHCDLLLKGAGGNPQGAAQLLLRRDKAHAELTLIREERARRLQDTTLDRDQYLQALADHVRELPDEDLEVFVAEYELRYPHAAVRQAG